MGYRVPRTKETMSLWDRYVEANDPSRLWGTLYNLLPPENAAKLRAQLRDLGIQETNTEIRSCTTDLYWRLATREGKEPWVAIGYGNYALYGMSNGKANQLLDTSGTVPCDESIYRDLCHKNKLLAVFKKGQD